MKNKVLVYLSIILSMLLGCTENKQKQNINTEPQSYSLPFSSNMNIPTVQPHVTTIQPTKSKNDERTIGSYTTKILDSSSSRLNNLKLACDNINGTIVQPGEIFSYNDDVGPVGPNSGYKKATMLNGHGEKIKGYGGGLCQISSTIYNAVKKANLEIMERHDHSKDVGYVKKGNDAAVNRTGGKDFKFKNTLNTPIKIYANVKNKKVNVIIKSINKE